MPKTLKVYQCAEILTDGKFCNGSRFIPRDFSVDKENGVDKPHSEIRSDYLDIGARCVRCGKIYKAEEVKKAYDRGFNFFANPL